MKCVEGRRTMRSNDHETRFCSGVGGGGLCRRIYSRLRPRGLWACGRGCEPWRLRAQSYDSAGITSAADARFPKPDSSPARGTFAAARHQWSVGKEPVRGSYVGALAASPLGELHHADACRHLRLPLIERHKAVRERLHEAHERILLCIRQTESPHPFCVHVVSRLRCRPADRAFAGIIGRAARQDVPRVVEMHNDFEALKISVVPISFDKGRVRPFVDIAQRRHPKAPLVVRHEGKPSRVHWRGLAKQMALSEKTADAAVDK